MHHNNSLINGATRLSSVVLSAGLPCSSNNSCALGIGHMAGTSLALILNKENASEVITCVPPKTPSDTVEIAIGFLCHSGYSKSIAFFRLPGYPPLYSG